MEEGENYNSAEMIALKLLLQLALEKNISNIQVYGDSLNIIKWIKGEQNHTNYLFPISGGTEKD